MREQVIGELAPSFHLKQGRQITLHLYVFKPISRHSGQPQQETLFESVISLGIHSFKQFQCPIPQLCESLPLPEDTLKVRAGLFLHQVWSFQAYSYEWSDLPAAPDDLVAPHVE